MPLKKNLLPGLKPFWMMNDASTVGERIEYLRACHAGGIKALALHCRSGNMVPYASTEWYEMITALVMEGKRLDMEMWLYDEDPYPSGAAGGQVMAERADLRAENLVTINKPEDIKKGDLWRIGRDRIIWAGLVPEDNRKKAKDLTGLVGTVRLDWFLAEWHSRFYYDETPPFPCERGDAINQMYAMHVPEIPKGYRLVAIAAQVIEGGSWDSLPSLLQYDTWHLYRRLSLDPYRQYVGREFGRTIPGIFTDEAKPGGNTPYAPDLFESFLKTYGYDLRPRIYQLFCPAISDEYLQTRIDYRRWVGERFLDAFIRPYRKWCDKNNLMLVGHFSPEDDPIAEVPCLTSVMPVMKAMTLPGTDIIVPSTGDSKAPTLNLGSLRVGSLKSQNGNGYAISETLALCGWDTTSEKGRQLYAWQKVLGVDRFFTHGFWTTSEGVICYEAPPSYGPDATLFSGTCTQNDWLKRMDKVMDNSRVDADVAILSVNTTFLTMADWANLDERYYQMRRSLWHTILACLRTHIGIHVTDENDLPDAKVTAKGLSVGKSTYKTIIVPDIDIIDAEALAALRTAADKGVNIYWLGKGPKQLYVPGKKLQSVKKLPGKLVSDSIASDKWCRDNLLAQATITGRGQEECYVRRFTNKKDKKDYLLAVNVGDKKLNLTFVAEKGKAWIPVEVDGTTGERKGHTLWQVPPRCTGLFCLDHTNSLSATVTQPVIATRQVESKKRKFTALARNCLRLQQVKVKLPGKKTSRHPYPLPYFLLSEDYRSSRIIEKYVGDVPVEGTANASSIRYCFDFSIKGKIPTPELVLDAHFARGNFRILVNNKALGATYSFPHESTKSTRIPVKNLKQGRNNITFVFALKHPLEGMLAQAYLEGDFDATPLKSGYRLTPRARNMDIADSGWQDSGLPHYMGAGSYRWTENFTKSELTNGAWQLEVDRVVDSAELLVNGKNMGTCAWAPFAWDLSDLKAGKNTFELIVTGSPGNRLSLVYPKQESGWIGGGKLIKHSS